MTDPNNSRWIKFANDAQLLIQEMNLLAKRAFEKMEPNTDFLDSDFGEMLLGLTAYNAIISLTLRSNDCTELHTISTVMQDLIRESKYGQQLIKEEISRRKALQPNTEDIMLEVRDILSRPKNEHSS